MRPRVRGLPSRHTLRVFVGSGLAAGRGARTGVRPRSAPAWPRHRPSPGPGQTSRHGRRRQRGGRHGAARATALVAGAQVRPAGVRCCGPKNDTAGAALLAVASQGWAQPLPDWVVCISAGQASVLLHAERDRRKSMDGRPWQRHRRKGSVLCRVCRATPHSAGASAAGRARPFWRLAPLAHPTVRFSAIFLPAAHKHIGGQQMLPLGIDISGWRVRGGVAAVAVLTIARR